MSDNVRDFLGDAFDYLIEQARAAKANATEADADLETRTFQQGRAMAYYEVVDHLLHQLDVFRIDRSSLGVDADFDPTRELL